MTWSILARDNGGRFGAAIASRFFAVGALCVHTQRGVGALSTQALMNPLYGPAGLMLLAQGHAPAAVVAALTATDAGQATAAVARAGRTGRRPRRTPARRASTGAAMRCATISASPATCWPARR